MNFAEAAKQESKWKVTENGAVAINTTGSALVDLFGSIGALRNADAIRIQTLFEEAYKVDPLLATKIMFYARDIRGGLGERRVFRELLNYAAKYHPECIADNIDLIGYYGRFDDLYSLIDTPLEDEMWRTMKDQLKQDLIDMDAKQSVSLLAKWLKTADASSVKTRRLGIRTAEKLGYSVRDYKRIVTSLRRYIKVVEQKMSANQWNKIEYPQVPSRAMMIYRNAFMRHDERRYCKFLDAALKGDAKINSSAVYPYDLVEKIYRYTYYTNPKEDDAIEAQWRALPNYVEGGANAIVMADTSGSMGGRPMDTALSLAIYFAERNTGAYHNMWMTFSQNPQVQILKGNTLAQKLRSMNMRGWMMNTNLRAAFNEILNIAIKNHVAPEDMPKSLIVISDMEIDACGDRKWTFYDQMSADFESHGYKIPSVIFWNVNSRHNTFHADANRKGVVLCSGSSPTVFKELMGSIGMDPVEFMLKVINNDRYAPITLSI